MAYHRNTKIIGMARTKNNARSWMVEELELMPFP
jgi:hypothetical protein